MGGKRTRGDEEEKREKRWNGEGGKRPRQSKGTRGERRKGKYVERDREWELD